MSDSAHALANPKRLLPLPVSCWWPSGTCSVRSRLIPMGPVQAVARTLHSFPARCGATSGKCRSQAMLLRHYLDQLGRGRRSGSNSLQRSPLSPQRRAPGKREDLRALLLPFLSGRPDSKAKKWVVFCPLDLLFTSVSSRSLKKTAGSARTGATPAPSSTDLTLGDG